MVVSEVHACSRFEAAHEISQEAIETISLWIIHYKDKQSIDTLVAAWQKVFKKSVSERNRIALFYIMNDAVQKAKGKHFDYLIAAFQPAVLSAITAARTVPKVKKVMQRCIEIFRDREVFTAASVTAMFNILHGAETGDIDDGCLELNNKEVCTNIESFEEGCKIADELRELVMNTQFETFHKIKSRLTDRKAAFEELQRSQGVHNTLVDVRHSMEAQKKRMLELVETLEIAKRLYAHALREVTVVEDAYQKFYHGIKETQKELLEMKRSGVYPAATPPRDCPSPSENDDIFASDGFSEFLNFSASYQIFFDMTTNGDNLEATDMDIGDDEHEGGGFIPGLAIGLARGPGLVASLLPQDFNHPPPGIWRPGNIPVSLPSSISVPPNFNLPPPQLISPGANLVSSPPVIPNMPPLGMFPPNLPPPSLMNLPPPGVPMIPAEPRPPGADPRQMQPPPFNGQMINMNVQQPFNQPPGGQNQDGGMSGHPIPAGGINQGNQRYTPYNNDRHDDDFRQNNYNRNSDGRGGYRNRRESYDGDRPRDPRSFRGRGGDNYRGGGRSGGYRGGRGGNHNNERWERRS